MTAPRRYLVIVEAPGKLRTIGGLLQRLGLDAELLATGGHIEGYPRGLFPVGLRPAPGRLLDPRRGPLRRARGFHDRLHSALRRRPDSLVLLAADNDAEGDVIAHDAARAILDRDPDAAGRLYRVLPSALTAQAWSRAIRAGMARGPAPLSGTPDSLESRAVEGRSGRPSTGGSGPG